MNAGLIEAHLDSLIMLLEPGEEGRRLNGDPGGVEGGQACGKRRPRPCTVSDEKPAKK